MRMPWNKPKVEQRDLVDEANDESVDRLTSNAVEDGVDAAASSLAATVGASGTEGLPLLVSVDCLAEDPHNPRTEFPEQEIAELAEGLIGTAVRVLTEVIADFAQGRGTLDAFGLGVRGGFLLCQCGRRWLGRSSLPSGWLGVDRRNGWSQ